MLDTAKLPDVSKLHPELETKQERLFCAHMLAREQALTKIFGKSDPPRKILSPSNPDLAVNWPGGGVYRFGPAGKRKGFTYVTHNLSQPFQKQLGKIPGPSSTTRSGFGIEYVISTPKKADWAPRLLFEMVKVLLFVEGARVFLPGHRIPASAFAALVPGTKLGALVGARSDAYESEIRLPGGLCTLSHLVGVTLEELEQAKSLGGSTRGTQVLLATLEQLGPGITTDPGRRCSTSDKRFRKVWNASLDAVPE